MPKLELDTVAISCAHCGLLFVIPAAYDQRLRDCHNTFYCPNGHKQNYPGETEETKLRRALEAKLAEARRLERENAELKKPKPKRRKPTTK